MARRKAKNNKGNARPKKIKLGLIVAVIVILLLAVFFLKAKEAPAPAPMPTPTPAQAPETPGPTIVREPQLQVTSVTVLPTSPHTGGTANIFFSIKNAGIGTAPATTVQISINEAVVSTVDLRSLLQGEAQSSSVAWQPTAAGNYAIKVYVAPVTGERITSDNTATARVTVT